MQTVHTAIVGNNSELFPTILQIYLPEGSVIADVTYGKGVFWRNVDLSKYKLLFSDLKTGTDLKKLPYENDSLDGFVIDPPYMPAKYTGISEFNDYYGITREFDDNNKKWDKAVLQMYYDGINEANRVLNKNGVLIIKCQDMVCANKQILVHCDLINYCSQWFKCEDIFILVQKNKKPHPRKRQVHARKNHSYFLIFIRNKRKWNGLFLEK